MFGPRPCPGPGPRGAWTGATGSMAEAWGAEGEGPGTVRRAVRALDDAALLEAMRAGEPAAWAEFMSRFGPLLDGVARRVGVPEWEVAACVADVLDDEALRLTGARATTPANLGGYLARVLFHHWLKSKRGAARRARWHAEALRLVPDATTDGVVRALCSSHALRVSEGVVEDGVATGALARLAALLTQDLAEDDLQLLAWSGEGVPRRQMAEWLGVGYEAARKRLLRLAHRLREVAAAREQELSPADRREIARVLRRAAAPIPRPHAARGGGQPGRDAAREETAHDH